MHFPDAVRHLCEHQLELLVPRRPGDPVLPVLSDKTLLGLFFFFSSRRRHTRYWRDWSSDVCSSDLMINGATILVLIAIIVREVWQVMLARRRGRAAARLHIQIVSLFSVIAVLPAVQIGRASCRERV